MAPATADANVMTKITATPIPLAVLVFFDTPRNGHNPRNWLSTTLLTREELIKIINNSLSICLLPLSLFIMDALPASRIRTIHTVAAAAGLDPGHIFSFSFTGNLYFILNRR